MSPNDMLRARDQLDKRGMLRACDRLEKLGTQRLEAPS